MAKQRSVQNCNTMDVANFCISVRGFLAQKGTLPQNGSLTRMKGCSVFSLQMQFRLKATTGSKHYGLLIESLFGSAFS